jgi:predicted transport protein
LSDIKLFRIDGRGPPVELASRSVALEKSLQTLIEAHLETFLGVRLLASEYSTGKVHGGRIDTLGIDENGCPVIVEYKRATNENVVNQGLFYLDWLMDHRGEFELLTLKKLGKGASDGIEWRAPRLLCIAGDFTKYDAHAVQQMNRNIGLVRYQKYGNELLLLELVNAVRAAPPEDEDQPEAGTARPKPGASHKLTLKEEFSNASSELRDLYDALKAYLLGLGDDVEETRTKRYAAFRRIKNFVCVVLRAHSEQLLVYVKVDPKSVRLQEGFLRDVSDVGHWGTGDVEISVRSMDDFEQAKPLLLKSYETS